MPVVQSPEYLFRGTDAPVQDILHHGLLAKESHWTKHVSYVSMADSVGVAQHFGETIIVITSEAMRFLELEDYLDYTYLKNPDAIPQPLRDLITPLHKWDGRGAFELYFGAETAGAILEAGFQGVAFYHYDDTSEGYARVREFRTLGDIPPSAIIGKYQTPEEVKENDPECHPITEEAYYTTAQL
jgi:hypothetical protein